MIQTEANCYKKNNSNSYLFYLYLFYIWIFILSILFILIFYYFGNMLLIKRSKIINSCHIKYLRYSELLLGCHSTCQLVWKLPLG